MRNETFPMCLSGDKYNMENEKFHSLCSRGESGKSLVFLSFESFWRNNAGNNSPQITHPLSSVNNNTTSLILSMNKGKWSSLYSSLSYALMEVVLNVKELFFNHSRDSKDLLFEKSCALGLSHWYTSHIEYTPSFLFWNKTILVVMFQKINHFLCIKNVALEPRWKQFTSLSKWPVNF